MAFEAESSLEAISPPSVKHLNESGINLNYELESVEFLGDYVKVACFNFQFRCGIALSFPKAKGLEFDNGSVDGLPGGSMLMIRRGEELVGNEFSHIQSRIQFIEKSDTSSIKSKSDGEHVEQIVRSMQRICFFETRLRRNEDVAPFDLSSKQSEEDNETERNEAEREEEQEHFH